MTADLSIVQRLGSFFQPSREAQGQMAPVSKKLYYDNVPATARKAAVLALLYPKGSKWHIVYIKRVSDDVRDKHAGQISFPGGKYELEDTDLYQTALRETCEEIGVDTTGLIQLGQLADLYIGVSNFSVYSYLAYYPEPLVFTPDTSEVDRVIEVPMDYLLDPNIVAHKDIRVRGTILKNIPYFDLYGEVLWGATAMLTSEVLYNYKKAI